MAESRAMITNLSLSCIFLKSFLKSKATRFLSKMLSASAMTIEGTKRTLSPFSHRSNISAAFALIFGLSVNHHRRACVSVTKFMETLYAGFAIEGFFCGGDVLIGNYHAL